MDRSIQVSVPFSNEPLARYGNVFKLNQQPTSWAGTSLPFSITTARVSKTPESHSKLSQGSGIIFEVTLLKSPVIVELASFGSSGLSPISKIKALCLPYFWILCNCSIHCLSGYWNGPSSALNVRHPHRRSSEFLGSPHSWFWSSSMWGVYAGSAVWQDDHVSGIQYGVRPFYNYHGCARAIRSRPDDRKLNWQTPRHYAFPNHILGSPLYDYKNLIQCQYWNNSPEIVGTDPGLCHGFITPNLASMLVPPGLS